MTKARCKEYIQVGSSTQVCQKIKGHKKKHKSKRITGNYTNRPFTGYSVSWN